MRGLIYRRTDLARPSGLAKGASLPASGPPRLLRAGPSEQVSKAEDPLDLAFRLRRSKDFSQSPRLFQKIRL